MNRFSFTQTHAAHQKGYSEETDLESKFGDNTQEWEEVRRQINQITECIL